MATTRVDATALPLSGHGTERQISFRLPPKAEDAEIAPPERLHRFEVLTRFCHGKGRVPALNTPFDEA